MTIDIIQTRGTRYEMGVQQGRLCRLIVGNLNMINIFRDMALVQAAKPIGGPPFNFVFTQITKSGARKILRTIRDYYPNQYERFEGIAEGFGINNNQLAQVIYMENFSGDCRLDMQAPKGCSAGIIHTDNDAYIMKNYDFPNELGDYQTLRYSDNNEGQGYKTMVLGEGPLVGGISGMNEYGLGLTLNAGYSKELDMKQPPATLVNQECLETCKNADEAIELISKAPMPVGWIISLMDKDGKGAIIERTPKSVGIREMETFDGDKFLTTANTFVCPETMKKQLDPGTIWSVRGLKGLQVLEPSLGRMEQMNEFTKETLTRNKGKSIPVSDLHKILAHHNDKEPEGGDTTICRHGLYYKTLSSIVMDLKKKIVYISDSQPCTVEKMDAHPFEFDYKMPPMRYYNKNRENENCVE
jgi:Acyl-coenzyme A:6-aminopenicillanic acid acyl-transferase